MFVIEAVDKQVRTEVGDLPDISPALSEALLVAILSLELSASYYLSFMSRPDSQLISERSDQS